MKIRSAVQVVSPDNDRTAHHWRRQLPDGILSLLRSFLLVLMSGLVVWPACGDEIAPEGRFEKDVRKLEEKFSEQTLSGEHILFIGSSSIRLWDLKASFPDQRVINHGFGGSHLSDSVHFFDRLVTPVRPTAIVMYAGDNDLADKKSPEAVANDFRSFAALVQDKVPDCRRVFYLSIKPSVKRWALADKGRAANGLIRDICAADPEHLTFVDIWDATVNDKGEPRPDLLVDDGLHLNPAGYEIWTRCLKAELAAAGITTHP